MGNEVLILGITGSIACGKSLVAELLQKKGAALLSADQLAREVVEPGTPLLAALVGLFGTKVLRKDGTLDRDRLGALVFEDDNARGRLNALLHPAIACLAERRLAALVKTSVPLVVYEAPLLFEAGAERRVDRVLVVTVDPDLQLKRLVERDQSSETAARRRIEAQMSQQEKAARADYLIDNSGSLACLADKVDQLWRALLA